MKGIDAEMKDKQMPLKDLQFILSDEQVFISI